MDKKELNTIIQIYKEKNFQINSERNMDVLGHNVHEMNKQGRKLILCDCQNHSRFSSESALCIHKLFYIIYPFLDSFIKEIDKGIDFYEVQERVEKDNGKIYNSFVQELRELKGIKFN